MWHVIVTDKLSGVELCRYSFISKAQAQEAQRNVKEIRVGQNHERVKVTLEKGKYDASEHALYG